MGCLPISGRPGSSISAAAPGCWSNPGRAGRDVLRWLSEQPRWWRDAVQVVAIDLSSAYRSGIHPSASAKISSMVTEVLFDRRAAHSRVKLVSPTAESKLVVRRDELDTFAANPKLA